jgi:hypothetical protein
LITLAGLKLLQTEFLHNKPEWTLVAQKAKTYLKKVLGGISDKDITSMVDTVEVSLKE